MGGKTIFVKKVPEVPARDVLLDGPEDSAGEFSLPRKAATVFDLRVAVRSQVDHAPATDIRTLTLEWLCEAR